MPTDVSAILLDLERAFSAVHVRWYVFGAQAVIAAGVPRLTADIDVTIEPPHGGSHVALATLKQHGFELRDVGDIDTFIAQTRVIPAVHAASRMPIDVVLAGPGLEQEMLNRIRTRTVRGVSIPFVSTSDLIALKILAGREKDLEDVRGLLRARPADLDIGEARQRVAELGAALDDSTLSDTFEELFQKAGGKNKPR